MAYLNTRNMSLVASLLMRPNFHLPPMFLNKICEALRVELTTIASLPDAHRLLHKAILVKRVPCWLKCIAVLLETDVK